MKKFFVIHQLESHCFYEHTNHVVAVRHCTQVEIESEVNRLNSSLINESHGFYFTEAPIDGFSDKFTLQFKDRDLQIMAYRSLIQKDIKRAYFQLQKRSNENVSLKDVFMSMGEVMDVYFNTAIDKNDVSELFDECIHKVKFED